MPRHKCKEQKLLQIDVSQQDRSEDDCEEVTRQFELTKHTPPQYELTFELTQSKPLSSLLDLFSSSTPQTIKLIGYIKH